MNLKVRAAMEGMAALFYKTWFAIPDILYLACALNEKYDAENR